MREQPGEHLMADQMVTETSPENLSTTVREPDYEVVVIGAGVGGLYQIKRLIDLGVNLIMTSPSPVAAAAPLPCSA